MARAWAIGPWTLLIVAAPFQAMGIQRRSFHTYSDGQGSVGIPQAGEVSALAALTLPLER